MKISSFVLAALMMASTEAGTVKQLVAETVNGCPKAAGAAPGPPGACVSTCSLPGTAGGMRLGPRVRGLVPSEDL